MPRFIYRVFIIVLLSFMGCSSQRTAPDAEICVSIAPLRSLVERIAGDDFRIEVLVPVGVSPETFDPTPRQLVTLHEARMVVAVGLLDFERSYLAPLADSSRVVTLCRGIESIGGIQGADGDVVGADPHVWLSPRELRRMAANLYDALCRMAPDSTGYAAAYRALDEELARLDAETAESLREHGVRVFYIYHPALGYYARAYGLEQVAVETEGREPSARRLARLIARARADGVRRLLYERQFPQSAVEAFCNDIGAEAAVIDPLEEDVVESIRRITDLIVAP